MNELWKPYIKSCNVNLDGDQWTPEELTNGRIEFYKPEQVFCMFVHPDQWSQIWADFWWDITTPKFQRVYELIACGYWNAAWDRLLRTKRESVEMLEKLTNFDKRTQEEPKE